jgi:hypothetical protein
VKQIFLVFALALIASAQQTTGNYTVEYSGTMTGSTAAVTVYLPTAETRSRVRFGSALIYNSAACDWRTERDGAAPTQTEVAAVKLNSYDPTAVFKFYRDSNVGTAARVHPTLKQITTTVVDLSKENLKPGEALTLRTPSNCTATYSVAIEVIQETY